MWKKVETGIYQVGDYSFRVRMMVNGFKVDQTFDTLPEARAFRDGHKYTSALDVHASAVVESRIKKAESKTFTFGDAITKYRPLSAKKKGAIQEASNLDLLSRLPIAKKPIYMIHKDDLLEMFADIRSGKYRKIRENIKKPKSIPPASDATARRYANLAQAIFEVATKEWKKIDRNPFIELSKNERPKDGEARNRRLQGNEYDLLKKQLTGQAGVAITVLVETAMRRGELLGLDWKNVKLNDNSGSAHLPKTKNNESRTVPLSEVVVHALNSLEGKREGRVFSGLTPSAMQHKWVDARAAIGSPDLRLHDLRHEGTSRLFEDKHLDVIEASKITGHKTLSMLARYAHLNVDKLAKKLNAPALPSAADDKQDIYEELIKLDNLRTKGILSKAEFTKQKKILLEKHNSSI